MTDTDEVAAAKERLEAAESMLAQELDNAWSKVLQTSDGRAVIWSILENCHIYHSTYTGNSLGNVMEGERNIGLKILNERVFAGGIETYTTILKEAESRDNFIQNQLDDLEQVNNQENDYDEFNE